MPRVPATNSHRGHLTLLKGALALRVCLVPSRPAVQAGAPNAKAGRAGRLHELFSKDRAVVLTQTKGGGGGGGGCKAGAPGSLSRKEEKADRKKPMR